MNYINEENIYLNKYYSNFQNSLLLLNKDYYEVIKKATNSLIPYFTELLDNNFYLLFPFEIFNGIQYFIKYFFNYSFFHKNSNFLSGQNINDLISLFINFSLKLLNNKNINEKLYLLKVIQNLKIIFKLFHKLYELENDDEDYENTKTLDINDFLDILNWDILISSIKKNFDENNEYFIKKIDSFFISYSSDYCNYNSDYVISNLLDYIKEDNFLFKNFIIDSFIKRGIIKNISKILKPININNLNEEKNKELGKFYFDLLCSLDCLYKYINEIKFDLDLLKNILMIKSLRKILILTKKKKKII